METKIKKLKEDKKKEEEMIKKQKEQMKKSRAEEAFKLWMKKKEEEKKIEKRMTFHNNNSSENKKKNLKRTNSTLKGKICIGPYSNAKELKEIQKSLNMYNMNDLNKLIYTTQEGEVNPEEENKRQTENIEDSLQELSSIKKDTPHGEPEPYYD